MAEVCERVLGVRTRPIGASTIRWKYAARTPEKLAEYLDLSYRGNGGGCLVAALGPELVRQNPEIRHAVTRGVREVIEAVAELMPGEDAAERRGQALAAMRRPSGRWCWRGRWMSRNWRGRFRKRRWKSLTRTVSKSHAKMRLRVQWIEFPGIFQTTKAQVNSQE